MKRIFSFFAAIVVLFSCAAATASAAGTAHTEDKYLYDTLTIAGSGFSSVQSYTVYALESLAADNSLGLGYENTYSMMTSGGEFSHHTFTGLSVHNFLLYCGLDETLPDTTPVKFISKDGYAIPFTLGDIRSADYSRFTSKDNPAAEETGLPVLIAYASNGVPLIGPTGSEPVYIQFDEEDGYVESAQNIGGPLRLIMGQTASSVFNSPNCAKWLAAIVVGDANGYEFKRETSNIDDLSEPEGGGDWTHGDMCSDFRLTISGSEASGTITLALSDIESMTGGIVCEYYAASNGKNAYEGVLLKYLISQYLSPSIDTPSEVTVISSDGYAKSLDINDLWNGVDSQYQPGKHKEFLLAYAINGSPLVKSTDSEGYDGKNAFGPLRLVVENTVSAWVKNVAEIVIGSADNSKPAFSDLAGYEWAADSINSLYASGIVSGVGENRYSPSSLIKRGDFMLMLCRAYKLSADTSVNFSDVPEGAYYFDAVAAAKALGIAQGDGINFYPENSITRQEAMTLIYRTLVLLGKDIAGYSGSLDSFKDAADVADWAQSPIKALVGAGIINGSEGRILPGGSMTRAQMAVALFRAINNIA